MIRFRRDERRSFLGAASAAVLGVFADRTAAHCVAVLVSRLN